MKRKLVLFMSLVLMCGTINTMSVYASDGERKNALQPSDESFYSETSVEEIQDTEEYSELATALRRVPKGNGSKFPKSVDLSQTEYFPPIGDQGDIGSCAAFATTYYQFTYEVNKLLDRSADTYDNIYTPTWVYNMYHDGDFQNGGMESREAYEFLTNQGSVTWSQLPYINNSSLYDGEAWPQSEDDMIEALNIRVKSCYNLEMDMSEISIASPTDEALDEVKSLLLAGKVLEIESVNSWNKGLTEDGEEIAYRCWDDGWSGHAMTVVGYDDTVCCDVNGDGIIEDAEKGAFKVANSWGTDVSNDGYMWVLYDALNRQTEITGDWETKCVGNDTSCVYRIPAFAFSDDFVTNRFFYIFVEEKDVNLIGVFEGNVDEMGALGLSFGKSSISTTSYSNATKLTSIYNGIARGSLHTGALVVDLENLTGDDIGLSLVNKRWYMNVKEARGYRGMVSGIAFYLKDNLGNVIGSANTTEVLQDSETTLNIPVNIVKGDADYNGEITSEDALLVLKKTANMIELSNIQMYLCDYNGDGVVDAVDANEILKKVAE